MSQSRVLIERLDQLIRMKGTGAALDLADRLNVSHTTVYEILECMKSMGAEIEYCRERRSFYYLEDKTLAIGIVNKGQIRGGQQFFQKLLVCQDMLYKLKIPLS